MNDDVLARAARALRAETEGDDAGARFTRSRIMASVHEERVKRRTRWAFLIPIAATFVVGSAFAAATGAGHRALEVVRHALGMHAGRTPATRASFPETPSNAGPRRAAKGVAPTPSTEQAPSAPPAAPPTEEPAVLPPPVGGPSPVAAPAAAVGKAGASSAPGSVAPAPSAADPTFELYRTAHQAHFLDRDWSRALSGWDAYLRAAPRGALAPEARYNRALCLLRLHRNDEARAALKPFAQGSYGSYRRDDAQKLLEALPPAPSAP
jgi:TolA-binding protein